MSNGPDTSKSPSPQPSPAIPEEGEKAFTPSQRIKRLLEIAIVFFSAPLLFTYDILPARLIMVGLLAVAIWALLLIRKHQPAENELGLGHTGKQSLFPLLAAGLSIWIVGIILAATLRTRQGLPIAPGFTDQPLWLWIVFPLLYAASAAAQELLFRPFFFWRYKNLMPLPALFVVNVIAFGWIHIVFHSMVSVGLSMLGGIIFTTLFLWRKSLLGIVIIHTLFGLAAFAMGFGHYFYNGHRL